ncbi:MAG TPA: TolC family protein, partial [bacterium]|nr:TolC family protein [bacterium]
PLYAQTTEIQVQATESQSAASTESRPVSRRAESRPSPTEGWEVPRDMPEGPTGFEEEKESALRPPPEVPMGDGPKLNLDDCLRMAMLNNREVRAKNFDMTIAQNKLKEAKLTGIPIFEYEFLSFPAPRDADHAVSSFFEGDLTFGQRGKVTMGIPLYSFGKIGIAQELARGGIDAEQEKKIDKQNDVVLKVKQLYYGLLLAKDVRELFQDASNHLANEVKRRESSREPADPVELTRLKLFRYEMLNRLLETDKKAALARDGLRIQLGMERATLFSLDEEHLTPVDTEIKEFDHYLELNRRNNPKNRLLDIGVKASEAQYRLERRKLAPDIGLGAFYEFGRTVQPIAGVNLTDDFNDPFNFNRVGFGLRIKGDINVNQYLAKTRAAQAEYFKNALNKEIADEGLELELKDAYLSVLQSKEAMENGYRAMKLARQFVFLTKTNIDIGVGDKKDYSDALQAYLVSRGRYLESVYNYNIAVAVLEQRSGGIARKE